MMREYGPGVSGYAESKRIKIDPVSFIPHGKRPHTENYSDYYENVPTLQLQQEQQPETRERPLQSLRGTLQYDLTMMLKNIRDYLAECLDKKEHRIKLADDVELTFPERINFSTRFYVSPQVFAAAYIEAFGQPFSVVSKSSLFPNLNIRINNISSASPIQPLSLTEQMFFRQMTCILFKKLFSLDLTSCACMPKTVSEIVAWQSGIYKNCYHQECLTWMQNNPALYDSLFMGPCDAESAAATSVVIAFIRAAASRDINVNVNIQQLIERTQTQS